MLKSVAIIFSPLYPIDENFWPAPSIKNIPEWYKNHKTFFPYNKKNIINGNQNFTIKKCIPVFDAMTAGYTIFTHCDIFVNFDQNGSKFFIPPSAPIKDLIEYHHNFQAESHPQSNMMQYPKFMSPWSIKTPRGYSCLFIPPMHNPNMFFNILPGIVDTDKYYAPVNFPFVLNDPTFSGIIPAGTPICQVIPFKRKNFKMKLEKSQRYYKKIIDFSHSYPIKFFNNYKDRIWQKKYYR